MKVIIRPSELNGTIAAPPSKSHAHRALICAALSRRPCLVSNVSFSDDILATLRCLEALGAGYEVKSSSVLVYPECKKGSDVFDCGESGSSLRFFVPLSLALNGGGIFCGSPRLMERGISEYERIFPAQGIRIEKSQTYITLAGELNAGKYVLRGDVSSQFVTGLMLALPLVKGDSEIELLSPVESRAYIELTLAVLRTFGISIVEEERNRFFIKGAQTYTAQNVCIEGDWSNAAFLMALKAQGADITVSGLDENSLQGDKVCAKLFESFVQNAAEADVSACPDLAPILMCFAAMNKGGYLTGTRRLKLKESDRAETMAQELRKFGAVISVEENSVCISHRELHAPTELLDGHNDHRIVMALSVLCLKCGGMIRGAEAVSKSWREFFRVLEKLGAKIEY